MREESELNRVLKVSQSSCKMSLADRCTVLDFMTKKAQQDLDKKQAILRNVKFQLRRGEITSRSFAEECLSQNEPSDEFFSQAYASEAFRSLQPLFPEANEGALFALGQILQSESLIITAREVACPHIDEYHTRMEEVMDEAEKSACKILKIGSGIFDPITQQFVILAHNGESNKNFECSWEMHELEMGCGHAEANALARASKLGMAVDRMSIWITNSPCYSCAQLIVSSGLKEVWFKRNHMDPFGVCHLLLNNVRATQILKTTTREFALVRTSNSSCKINPFHFNVHQEGAPEDPSAIANDSMLGEDPSSLFHGPKNSQKSKSHSQDR